MNHKLSLRLQKIIDAALGNFNAIYDLCCDHGKIGMALSATDPNLKIYLVDQVDSIINDLYSYIPKKEKIQILKEDCRKLEIYGQKNLYIIAGIGGHLAVEIFHNIKNQDKDATFLFCLNQSVEDLKEAIQDSGQNLISEEFFIDNEHGYYLFMTNKSGGSDIQVFYPSLFDFKSSAQKAYVLKLLSYYKTKTRFSPGPKSLKYMASLEEILAKFV